MGMTSPVSKTYIIGAVFATSPSFLHVRVVLNMVNNKCPLLHKHWFETDRGPDTGVRVQMPLDHPLDRRRLLQETATTASTPPRSFRATLPCTTCTSIRDSLPSTWYRCRLDKASMRWKNVLAPPRHSQLNVIGTCFEITDKYRLGIDMRSLNPRSPPPTQQHP